MHCFLIWGVKTSPSLSQGTHRCGGSTQVRPRLHFLTHKKTGAMIPPSSGVLERCGGHLDHPEHSGLLSRHLCPSSADLGLFWFFITIQDLLTFGGNREGTRMYGAGRYQGPGCKRQFESPSDKQHYQVRELQATPSGSFLGDTFMIGRTLISKSK